MVHTVRASERDRLCCVGLFAHGHGYSRADSEGKKNLRRERLLLQIQLLRFYGFTYAYGTLFSIIVLISFIEWFMLRFTDT